MKQNVPPINAALLIAEPLVAGCSAIYAQYLMAGLSRARVHHPMLTPSAPGTGLLSKEETRYVQSAQGLEWLRWRPFVFRKIVAWALQEEPEIIHGISEHTAHLCAHLSEALKLPYVITAHQFLERPSLHLTSRCRAVIAVSEPLREHLIKVANVAPSLTRVVAPGVSESPGISGPVAVAPDEPHASMDTGVPVADSPPDAHLVVSIGNFNSTSDYATFMEAIRQIADHENEGCSIVLCGEGPQESSLRKFCRELKLDKRVTLCHAHTEVERLLADADVYVQTTRREGFAVRALQAMVLGVPVIAAANGAVNQLIEDGVTGFIVPPANHELLAQRISTLLHNRELREKMGAAGRIAAREFYSPEKMMEKTLAVYRDAVLAQESSKGV